MDTEESTRIERENHVCYTHPTEYMLVMEIEHQTKIIQETIDDLHYDPFGDDPFEVTE